jgi:hypothetical protein
MEFTVTNKDGLWKINMGYWAAGNFIFLASIKLNLRFVLALNIPKKLSVI